MTGSEIDKRALLELYLWQYQPTESFTNKLFTLFAKADKTNFVRLMIAFPQYGFAYSEWYHDPDPDTFFERNKPEGFIGTLRTGFQQNKEFAYGLGIVNGYLSKPGIVETLGEYGVPSPIVFSARDCLKFIAEKLYYSAAGTSEGTASSAASAGTSASSSNS